MPQESSASNGVSFLPAGEQTGRIRAPGRWVTATACHALHTAASQLPDPGFSLAMNASPRELHHPDFVPDQAVSEAEVDPQRLCWEVTEATLIADLGETSAVLRQIRGLGVPVAVDDFGTGFSSMAYLHRLPVDILEIDQSFGKTMTTTSTGEVTVAHVISLGLTVTAEGVETAQQLEQLEDLGGEHGQGHPLGRPQPWLAAARGPTRARGPGG